MKIGLHAWIRGHAATNVFSYDGQRRKETKWTPPAPVSLSFCLGGDTVARVSSGWTWLNFPIWYPICFILAHVFVERRSRSEAIWHSVGIKNLSLAATAASYRAHALRTERIADFRLAKSHPDFFFPGKIWKCRIPSVSSAMRKVAGAAGRPRAANAAGGVACSTSTRKTEKRL